MTSGRAPLIDVAELSFTYSGAERPAVESLDFEVGPGEIFGFLGPNGAGKSTTQKILIGLLRGFEGRVSVLGRELTDWGSDLYEKVGVAFEFPNHYSKLTGHENLEYFRRLYRGVTRPPLELLERVGLRDDADTPVGQYSKGMKHRLSVARALINEPELLFLDEPTSGLDPVSARNIKDLVREERDLGRTIFLTTHDMAVADQLCDRVALIVDSRIALVETPRALKLRHGAPRVRLELGSDVGTETREFPLAGLGANSAFLELLRTREIQTMHTLEATLEDVFIQVTGRSLR
jgi:fluoroquinolone transport system ATP-binding protein